MPWLENQFATKKVDRNLVIWVMLLVESYYWKLCLHSSSHMNLAFLVNNDLRGLVISARLGINCRQQFIKPRKLWRDLTSVGYGKFWIVATLAGWVWIPVDILETWATMMIISARLGINCRQQFIKPRMGCGKIWIAATLAGSIWIPHLLNWSVRLYLQMRVRTSLRTAKCFSQVAVWTRMSSS